MALLIADGATFLKISSPIRHQTSVKEAPMGFFDKLNAPDICVRGISDFIIFSAGVGRDAGAEQRGRFPRQVSERRCIARVQATYSSPCRTPWRRRPGRRPRR